MSYDISLKDPVTKKTIEFDTPHQMRGGTFAVGGTLMAWLNVTYNYSCWYYHDGVFPNGKGLRSIYGLSAADSVPVLESAIQKIQSFDENLFLDRIDECKQNGISGYWLPTRRNALAPLYQLLAMAKTRPDGVWDGD